MPVVLQLCSMAGQEEGPQAAEPLRKRCPNRKCGNEDQAVNAKHCNQCGTTLPDVPSPPPPSPKYAGCPFVELDGNIYRMVHPDYYPQERGRKMCAVRFRPRA